jgi:hypothetical protein
MKKSVYVFIMLIVGMANYAQSSSLKIGGNPYYLTPSSIFEVESSTKGILLPRMTTTQRGAITNPANGLIIFNTTTNKLEFNSGTTVAPSWSEPEIVSNKSINVTTDAASDTKFPSVKAVKTYVDAQVSAAVPDADAVTKGKLQLTNELGGTAALPTISNAAVIAKTLTGFATGTVSQTVSATDNILQAFQKINGNVALRAPIDSPSFTGTVNLTGATTVTAPTPATSTSSNQVATTAFVTNVNNTVAIATKTANYTALSSDRTLLIDCTSNPVILTLPTAASSTGKIYYIRKIDEVNDLTISPAVKYSATTTSSAMNLVGTMVIQSDGTSWWVIE